MSLDRFVQPGTDYLAVLAELERDCGLLERQLAGFEANEPVDSLWPQAWRPGIVSHFGDGLLSASGGVLGGVTGLSAYPSQLGQMQAGGHSSVPGGDLGTAPVPYVAGMIHVSRRGER